MKSILKWMPALLLVSLFSCAGEKDIFDAQLSEKPGVYGYLTPIIEEGAETRATVQPDNDWNYVWETGDRINIWSSTGTLLIYTVSKVSDSGRAEFTGGGFTLTEGETYYSSHPLIRSVLDDYKTLSTPYEGQVQTANNDGRHLAEYTYTYTSAVCTNGNTSFQYHHLTCYLRFVITLPKAMTLTELTISANGDLFALDGKSDITTGEFTPGRVSDSITLTLDDIEVSDKLLKAFMCVAPCEAGTYVIRVKDSEGKVYTSPEISKGKMQNGWAYRFETEVFEGEDPVVCKIGDVAYTTLADAIADVPADGTQTTITMIADHSVEGNAGVAIDAGKNVVLDLNGKTVTLVVAESKGSQLITNRGTLTITDSSSGQGGKLTNVASENLEVGTWPTSNYVTNIITNSGTLNIEGGTIQNTANGSICYAVDNNNTSYDAILNVNGGYLTAVGTVIRQFCNSTAKQNVLNISGGTVETNGSAALWTQLPGSNGTSKKLATLNITGGVVRGASYAWYDYSFGDSFEAVNYSISGGELYGYLYSYAVADGVIPGFVTGGLFSKDVSSVCAPGKMCVASSDHPGMYEIAEAEVYYAWEDEGTMVGENTTFAAPFVNGWLMDGEFLTLLKNVTLTADIACQLESGTFSLTLGDYSVTKGDYSVSLHTGVSVLTDKQTDIFSAAESGYAIVETALSEGDFHYKYSVAPYVAQIGDVKYTTLADAVAAVPTDGTQTTITMIGDEAVVAGVTIAAGKNIVLELNGKTISGNTDATTTYALITNRGTLVIQDNSDTNKDGTGNGLITTYISNPDGGDVPGYASNTITNNGTLTVKSGKIVNNGSGYACFAIDSQTNGTLYSPVLTIEGGRMQQMNAYTYAVRMFCNSTTKVNTVAVSGGVIEGGYGLWLQTPNDKANMASLTISGGTLNANDGAALYIGGTKAVNSQIFINVSGGTINGTGVIIQGPLSGTYGEVSISDGDMYNVQCGANVEKFITGGVYHQEPNAAYIADGYKAVENNGLWTIVEMVPVATVNGVLYETLEAAFAAAEDGQTITLVADCAGNGIVAPQGKFASSGVTLDFNGHTYEVNGELVGSSGTETQGMQFLKDNKITLKNGTFTSSNALFLIQNYSNLTLENMTLSLTNASYAYAYTLSNNNGTVVIDGTTINANTGGGFAFDVCRNSSYPSVNVTVKGGSTINGNVEVSASGSDPKDGFSLTLTSATMNGDIVLDVTAKTAMANYPDKAFVKKNDSVNVDAPTGYGWVSNGDGTSTLKPAVAQVGGIEYATLEAAFAAATDGQTITLVADCAGNGIVAPQGKFASSGVTLDFNGHTYEVNGELVGSSGTETQGMQFLKDNKITLKNGTFTSSNALFLIQNYSNLTLENMTLSLTNASYAYGYTLSNNNGTVVIDGTTINANTGGGFAFDVCRNSSYPSVNVTVKGGSTINGNVEVSASGSDPKDGFSLTLTSATMNGDIVLDVTAKTAMANYPDKAFVKKNDAVSVSAPEGYAWASNGDGTSTLKPAVAKVGGIEYATLEDAFAGATDGQTITLAADCAGNGIVAPQGKFASSGVTLDFNGHTYEVNGELVGSSGTETQGMQFLKDNKITLKNGTFTSSNALFLIQNYSNLTLENMKLSLTNASYAYAYTLSNNNGTVVIDGTTINANTGGGFAFDVCRNSSYPSVHVTVKGNSVINGDVEVSASGSDPKDGFSLTLTSATMNGDIVLDGTAKTAMANYPDKAFVKKNDSVNVDAPTGYGWVSNGDGTSTLKAN